jgi:chromosome partitioning protein
MAILVGVVSQKGGVGKSMLCRLFTTEYARMGWKVLIADMDTSQSTSFEWNALRKQYKIAPSLDVHRFQTVDHVLKIVADYDLVSFDGAPHATRITQQIAHSCDLVVLPSGSSLEDLNPQIRLAHELKETGVPQEKIVFVLSRIGSSKVELQEVLTYLGFTDYFIITGQLPEQTAFRQAVREGKTSGETKYSRLSDRCAQLVQSIVDRIKELTN